MAHTTLYRRFRPIIFDQVIGQDYTINTLKNQLESSAISHAYLFIGSRGTGKTSTAKILARAVNCLNPDGVNPCNHCQICQSILNDANMDVFEMDAASNNGVDDIRELKQIIKFPPSTAKYKVIIIDEVHMLSDGAFNALLKTLEEPPSYMLFILATTEPHKIPATILSRCQRYDFNRISTQQITDELVKDCSELKIKADQKALSLISRLADGAMRDARSILEQCIAHAGDNLTYDSVSFALGKTSDLELVKLADAILTQDDSMILDSLDCYYHNGKDIVSIFTDLIYLFRSILRDSVLKQQGAQDISEAHIAFIDKVSGKYSKTYIIGILQALIDSVGKIKLSPYAWVTAELSLLGLSGTIQNQALSQRQSQNIITKVRTETSSNMQRPQLSTEEKKLESSSDSELNSLWSNVLTQIASVDKPMHAIIKNLLPMSYDDEKLVLLLSENIASMKEVITASHNIRLIEQTFKSISGKSCSVVIKHQDMSQANKSKITTFFNKVAPQATITME